MVALAWPARPYLSFAATGAWMGKDLLLSGLTPVQVRAYVSDLLKFVESIAPARRRFSARWSSDQEEGEEQCVIALPQQQQQLRVRIVVADAEVWARLPVCGEEFQLARVGDLHDFLLLYLAPDVASMHCLHMLSSGLFSAANNDDDEFGLLAVRYRAAMRADFRIELKECGPGALCDNDDDEEEVWLEFWLHSQEKSMQLVLDQDLRVATAPLQPEATTDNNASAERRQAMESIEHSFCRSCLAEEKKNALPTPEFLPRTRELLLWAVEEALQRA